MKTKALTAAQIMIRGLLAILFALIGLATSLAAHGSRPAYLDTLAPPTALSFTLC